MTLIKTFMENHLSLPIDVPHNLRNALQANKKRKHKQKNMNYFGILFLDD